MGALRRPTATERRAIGKPAAIRADIALGSNDRLLIYETAANEPKAEFKVISGEQQVLYLVLADMPGVNHDRVFGEGLRPTWFARLCDGGKNIIIVASGSGATGESQFFVAFIGEGGNYENFHLPVSTKGRLEVFRSQPNKFVLWTIPKGEPANVRLPHYEVITYELRKNGFNRLESVKTKKGYDPDEFTNHPIVLAK